MEDHLIRVYAKEIGVRGIACVTTNLVREAAQRHQTIPAATLILGRSLTGAALVGALLKVQQRVSLKFQGDGSLRKVIVESDSYGRVRGYVSDANGSELITPDAPLDAGQLIVVKDVLLKDLVESIVPLVTGQIDDDIELYLNNSEQIPSAVEIDVATDEAGDITMASGILLQAMPGGSSESVSMLVDRLQEMPPLAVMLQSGSTPTTVLAELFDGIDHLFLEERALSFVCSCSWERSEKALASLGRTEVAHLIETEGETDVECHFCHEKYHFDRADLLALLDKM